MNKVIANAMNAALEGNGWKKFTKVTVIRGKTVWPKKPALLEQYGVRFDYDNEVVVDGVTYNKFQMQPNAGKIPASVKQWRDANSTHGVILDVLVKKDGEREDVREAFETAAEKKADK